MNDKRLTLFAGHYGSGKTNIAVNYAIRLAKEGKRVCIADLDIVNPYFRTKDSAEELSAVGIDLISPRFANTNVDLPALPADKSALPVCIRRYGYALRIPPDRKSSLPRGIPGYAYGLPVPPGGIPEHSHGIRHRGCGALAPEAYR